MLEVADNEPTDAATSEFLEEEKRREVILEKLPPVYQTRYRELLQLHDHPNPVDGGKTLTTKLHQELLDMNLVRRGPELLGESYTGPKDVIEGLESVANYVREKYNYQCRKDTISKWTRGERPPASLDNKFPSAFNENRFRKADIDAWCDKWLTKPGVTGAPHKMDAKQRREEDAARKEKLLTDDLERELSGKWVLGVMHAHTLTTAGIQVRNTARDVQEIQTPKIFAEGLSNIVPDEATRDLLLQKLRDDTKKAFGIFQASLRSRIEELIESSKPEVREVIE